MSVWYVYQHDGAALGPWATETVGAAIVSGSLSPDVWIAAPGGSRWLRARDVPVIARLIGDAGMRPRRDSGLCLIAPAISDATRELRAAADATMMIVDERELYEVSQLVADHRATLERSAPAPAVNADMKGDDMRAVDMRAASDDATKGVVNRPGASFGTEPPSEHAEHAERAAAFDPRAAMTELRLYPPDFETVHRLADATNEAERSGPPTAPFPIMHPSSPQSARGAEAAGVPASTRHGGR